MRDRGDTQEPFEFLRKVAQYRGPSARVHHFLLSAVGRFAPRLRGLRWSTILFGKVFSASNAVLIAHEAGFRILVYLCDPYWSRLLFASCRYEIEVQRCLESLLSPEHRFVDGGANIGYWTLFAGLFTRRLIAVEPSRSTFERLEENVALSGREVTLVNAALDREGGRRVKLFRKESRHGGAHLAHYHEDQNCGNGMIPESVDTTTLDTICPDRESAIVKLDVEGSEIAALTGAQRLLEAGSLFIYEDHGQDRRCEVSAYLLDHGCALFSFYEPPRELSTTSDVLELKRDRKTGYNFVACRRTSEFYPNLKTSMSGG